MDFRDTPKVELHCHLEACFRPATVIEVGADLGLDIPADPAVFHSDWLLSKPLESLQVALARFVEIQRIWCGEEVIERLTFEACEDARARNIRIMEFRYAPDFIAGEEPGSAAQVRDAIEQLGAGRIGHGLHIIHDESVLSPVRERGVVLEICPTSNWLTSSVPSTKAHPVRALKDAGINITINSDDPSLFGIDLDHEYELLKREHGFTDDELAEVNDLAARHSFVSEADKARVWHGHTVAPPATDHGQAGATQDRHAVR